MQAYVIQHLNFEDLGNLEPELKKKGFTITYFSAVSEEQLNFVSENDCDLLIILGGPIGVYEHEQYPYLTKELEIIAKRVESDQATIGICLGCQLIAAALGAKVYPGNEKEIGWFPIHVPTGTDSQFMSPLSGRHVLHWHGDTFDLPKNAQLIASSAAYENQGFILGRNILGLQFHPEVTPEKMEQWFIGHAVEISATSNTDVATLRNTTRQHGADMQQYSGLMWRKWLEQIGFA